MVIKAQTPRKAAIKNVPKTQGSITGLPSCRVGRMPLLPKLPIIAQYTWTKDIIIKITVFISTKKIIGLWFSLKVNNQPYDFYNIILNYKWLCCQYIMNFGHTIKHFFCKGAKRNYLLIVFACKGYSSIK